jgi:hypothetical protein
VPRDDGRRREHRRLYALRALDIPVDTLPSGLQRLLLGHVGTLSDEQRRRLANALLAREVPLGRIGLVLQLLGDAPQDDADLAALAAARAREMRVTENFSVHGLLREERAHHGYMETFVHYLLRISLDEAPERELTLDLLVGDLTYEARFRRACVRQAAFVPLFKHPEDPHEFGRFVNALLAPFRRFTEDPHA